MRFVTVLTLAVMCLLLSHSQAHGGHKSHPMFDSGQMQPGSHWQHTFDDAGWYDYRCSDHEDMKAHILVKQRDATRVENHTVHVESSGPGWRFSPDALSIQAGDTVVWQNEAQVQHTVTALTMEVEEVATPGLGGPTGLFAVSMAFLAAAGRGRRLSIR